MTSRTMKWAGVCVLVAAMGCGEGESGTTAAEINRNENSNSSSNDNANDNANDNGNGNDNSAGVAPVLGAVGDRSVNEGDTLSILLSASDGDSDPLTITAAYGGSDLDPFTEASVAPTLNNNVFEWQPATGDAGTYSVTFTVTEDTDDELFDEETVTVTVNPPGTNNAPVLDAVGPRTVTEGDGLILTLSASDTDGDMLSFTAEHGGGAMNPFTASPAATFDPGSRTFSWVPGTGSFGSYDILFTVTDDGTPPESDSETVTLTVNTPTVVPALRLTITEVIRDSMTSGRVEFTNRSGMEQAIGDWRVCGTRNGIATSGNNSYPKNIPPGRRIPDGDSFVLHWNLAGTDGTDLYAPSIGGTEWGSVAMYDESGGFGATGNNNSIETYLQWISDPTGQGSRCSVAVDKGVWESCSDFVTMPAIAAEPDDRISICLPPGADPTLASSWVQDTTPELGMDSGCD